MCWYLWVIAGAAAAALAFIVYVCVINYIDDRSRERQQAIRSRQNTAEQNMQQTVQNTISEMFRATRGYK